MPELPEVETVCRGIQNALQGNVIETVHVFRPDIRFPIPKNLADLSKGQTLSSIHRRGKYALLNLSNDQTIIIHLGMSGRILITPTGENRSKEKHDHVVFDFKDGAQMAFNDPRRFGFIDITPTASLEEYKFFASMGPEPLSNHFNGDYLLKALQNKKSPIKTALLDQKIVSGLGNIYVCEALFKAGISPIRTGQSLNRDEIEKLTHAIKETLTIAIEAGGSSLKDYQQTDGTLGYFQHQFAVYGKAGGKCPECCCDIKDTDGIQKIVQAGRSTFYCSSKQS